MNSHLFEVSLAIYCLKSFYLMVFEFSELQITEFLLYDNRQCFFKIYLLKFTLHLKIFLLLKIFLSRLYIYQKNWSQSASHLKTKLFFSRFLQSILFLNSDLIKNQFHFFHFVEN
jgi:hypothetical protein